ncbi:hypothetical protein ACJJIK_10775 [Microbulbifer sp. ZKSA006]|uniref:hypothetical protein n=1 Tax=Microbulbifer sp. ZKSA006 TaxID=3243390 RepID=UPI0040394629
MKPVKEFQEIAWVEMTPDVYDGPNCDQIKPQWTGAFKDDMDSENGLGSISFDAKHFPPGAKIVVSVPCCPECGAEPELCQSDDSCDFDWDFWARDTYQ